MLTNSLGPNILEVADHALAGEYLCSRSLATAATEARKLFVCVDTGQRTLYLMGNRISECAELCPYLYDPTFVRPTYLQITRVVAELPLLAIKQANLVKSVRRGYETRFRKVVSGHTAYGEILDIVRRGRQTQSDHLSLKVALSSAANVFTDKELQESCFTGFMLATRALATLHSTWLQWVARLKVVCVAALRQSQHEVEIKRFHELLITLTLQQKLISQSLEQSARWRAGIDLDDLTESNLLLNRFERV